MHAGSVDKLLFSVLLLTQVLIAPCLFIHFLHAHLLISHPYVFDKMLDGFGGFLITMPGVKTDFFGVFCNNYFRIYREKEVKFRIFHTNLLFLGVWTSF